MVPEARRSVADTGRTVWADLFWADGFWAAGFWSGNDAPVVVADTPTGGFFLGYDHAKAKRERKKRELEEMEAEQQSIADEQAREIAELLRVQEERDAERADLERIQALADSYVKSPKPELVPTRVRAALYNAHEQRTKNALEQMRREIDRMLEEEELAVIAALLMDD